MANTKTVRVPHLGGIDAGYQMPYPYDASKPTLVLINSFTTSSELYRSQFENKRLTDTMNLLAIELLGHGQTRTKSENFTYWDTAIMNLQVLDAMKIPKAFVLGTSQGGWVTARMALIAPDRITGIIPLGTSMDYESERTRLMRHDLANSCDPWISSWLTNFEKLGCWDGFEACTGSINEWTTNGSTPDFRLSKEFCDFLLDVGFGKNCGSETRNLWTEIIQSNYQGDEGRKRARMAAINLRDRDGLHGRLSQITCPVLWLHGTDDAVYSVQNAEEEIKLFVNSRDAQLKVVQGGQHFLSFSHPQDVDDNLIEFVSRCSK